MGFALGMGIDCGGGGDFFFFFWGNFGGEELVFVAKFCGCVALPERERRERDESELFILFGVEVVYRNKN